MSVHLKLANNDDGSGFQSPKSKRLEVEPTKNGPLSEILEIGVFKAIHI
jgi:hypothetical protein